MNIKFTEFNARIEQLETQQVSFMNNVNVTMVTIIVENSQIQRAVDLPGRMNCEMQLNIVLNAHVAVHSSTFQRNKMCISLSEHPVCVLYRVDIYTHKRTRVTLSSVQHSAVTLHVSHRHTSRFPQTHFRFPTDKLHTELDTLRRSHKQF